MARKLGIKGDPLAAPLVESPSVMDGILDRNRERAGRSAPEEPIKLAETVTEQPSYQVTKIPNSVTNSKNSIVETVVARSLVRGQGQVQTGIRVTEELYGRLEEVQHALRRRGVTRQGILIVGLERVLAELEEELGAS